MAPFGSLKMDKNLVSMNTTRQRLSSISGLLKCYVYQMLCNVSESLNGHRDSIEVEKVKK